MSQQSTPTILTPTSSYSHPSTTASGNPTMQVTSPLSAQQSCKYMQQRIKQLEKDLEDTRLQLFTSEEARADLEARTNFDVCVEGSARTRHSIEYNGVEQLNYHESILTREEDHQQEISRLHQYYKGVNEQDKEENKLLHEKLTQFNDLSDSIDCLKKRHKAELQEHERVINRLKERHEAELQQREGLLQAQHDEENLKQLKDHSDLLKSIEKRHQITLENTKDKDCEFLLHVRAVTSRCHEREMAELQDVFQAELRLSSEDYEAEKARTLKYHEAEHQAEVAEFAALLRTHQALVKEHETMGSSHHAEVEAMKTEYETAIETYETKLLRVHERQKKDLSEMKEGIQSEFGTHEEELMRNMVNSYLGLMGLKKACLGRFAEAGMRQESESEKVDRTRSVHDRITLYCPEACS